MAVMKRRVRLVTFRTSSEEYELLRQSCIDSGARSISEFARGAVLKRVEASKSTGGLLFEDLATVATELSGLDDTLSELHLRIRRVLGSVNEGWKGSAVDERAR